MRKAFALVICMMMLLAGCGTDPGETTGNPSSEETVKKSGIYIPNSAVERESGGAVKVYEVGGEYTRVYLQNGKLLLAADNGELALFRGESCIPAATCVLGTDLESACLCVAENGVGYYLQSSGEFVLLNPQLQETTRFPMPEDMIGSPLICLHRNEVFYCTQGEIRAKNIETEISRPVRKHSYKEQRLTGCYFDGQIITCVVKSEDGSEQTMYLSAEDGQLLSSDPNLIALDTDRQQYYAERKDGIVTQQIVGIRGAESRSFLPREGATVGAWKCGGVLQYAASDSGLKMDLYDPETGKWTASLEIPGLETPKAFSVDESGIWFLAQSAAEGRQLLFKWDPNKTAVEDDQIYTGPLYTADMPDKEGLKACTQRADSFRKQYGVRVSVYQKALQLAGELPMTAEHQPEAYQQVLDALEAAFAQLPEGFISGDIRLGIVRDIKGGQEPLYIRSTAIHTMVLPVGCDIAGSFYQLLGYVLDADLAEKKGWYTDWNTLNPEGFQYGSDSVDTSYLSGKERAFISRDSMLSPADDRAELFAAAMKEGNDALFAGPVLQKKLRAMCEAIRADYWQGDDSVKPRWEAYLKPEA